MVSTHVSTLAAAGGEQQHLFFFFTAKRAQKAKPVQVPKFSNRLFGVDPTS
jgi:hypothetical protein